MGLATVPGYPAIGLKNEKVFTNSTIPHRIRVDHNTIKNAYKSGNYFLLTVYAHEIYGVVDNNISINNYKMGSQGEQEYSWNNKPPYVYGTNDNIYFEDNTFEMPTNSTFSDSTGVGGRYCARYNTFVYLSQTVNGSFFDAHGNQPAGVYSSMGTEIYGNKVTCPNRSGMLFAHRGGKALVFFNDLGSGSFFTAYAREE